MPVWDPDKNAVKQDLVEFRKDPAKVQKYINDALEHGYFIALEEARATKLVGMALFQHEYRRYHDALLPEISEARKVLPHIRMAIDRLEQACKQGRDRRQIERLFAAPDNVNVQDAIRALQGWLATFFGNYLKFVGFVRGSRISENVIRQWAADSLENPAKAEVGTIYVDRPRRALPNADGILVCHARPHFTGG